MQCQDIVLKGGEPHRNMSLYPEAGTYLKRCLRPFLILELFHGLSQQAPGFHKLDALQLDTDGIAAHLRVRRYLHRPWHGGSEEREG
jgi:hypothetical protein